jgi:hypothetical protein
VAGKRRFESETVLRALQRAFFNGSKGPAATNRSDFNPILLPSIALVCTIVRDSVSDFSEGLMMSLHFFCVLQIEHCLREWETGKCVLVNLDEATDGSRYRTHMNNATSWQGLNREATTKIREHLSKKLLWVPSRSSADLTDTLPKSFLRAGLKGG